MIELFEAVVEVVTATDAPDGSSDAGSNDAVGEGLDEDVTSDALDEAEARLYFNRASVCMAMSKRTRDDLYVLLMMDVTFPLSTYLFYFCVCVCVEICTCGALVGTPTQRFDQYVFRTFAALILLTTTLRPKHDGGRSRFYSSSSQIATQLSPCDVAITGKQKFAGMLLQHS